MSMNLMVLTCAVFPSYEVAGKKLWIFLNSCEKFGVDNLQMYGVGRGFPGYKYMKLDLQLEYLKRSRGLYPDITHVLYTDGWDAFFTAPMAEITEHYERLGSPKMLVSAYSGLGNVPEPEKDYPNLFDETKVYRYPNVGGYIGEIDHVIEMFERMVKLPRQTGDDCFNWYDAWQEGWFRPALDSNCDIFQVTDEYCVVDGGKLLNTRTGSHPCILHLCGGYTDPVTGKDGRVIPWAQRLLVL